MTSLVMAGCGECGRWVHPQEPACPVCGGEISPRDASGRGTVLTWTVNHQPFHPAVPVPYAVALIELVEQEGLRVPATLFEGDPEAVRTGLPVRVWIEQRGDAAVPVFASVEAEESQ